MPLLHLTLPNSSPGYCVLPIQPATNVPAKAAEDSTRTCVIGDPAGIPGSWLWPGSTLAVGDIWAGSQQMEDEFSPSLSLSVILPFK